MKTVTTIHLNGRSYQVEAEAHTALAAYLEMAAEALLNDPDKDEIMADFETAIAEKFAKYLNPNKNVITLKEIETIIAEMGPVAGETTSSEGAPAGTTKSEKPKRLYRDPDNRILAGVASGIAQYFGIDPVVVRVLFALSTLLGGAGVLIYIVIWLTVPEALTTAQKLEMRGSTVTFSAMADMLKEKVEEVSRKNNSTHTGRKITNGFVTFFQGIGTFIQKGILPTIKALIGLGLMAAGFIGAVSVTIAAGLALFASPSALSDISVITASAGAMFYIALAATYLAVIIPLAAVFFAGVSLMGRKNPLRGMIGTSLLIIWFLAIITAGVTGTRSVLDVRRGMIEDTTYQQTTETVSLPPFTTLDVSNGQNITYTAGSEYSVTMDGRKKDIENISVESANGTLVIKQREDFIRRGCFIFCISRENVRIAVTSPTLENVTLKNASSFEGDIAAPTLSVNLKNASDASLGYTGASLAVSLENSSRINVTGTTNTLTIEAKNASTYDGFTLTARDIRITAQNASDISVGQSKTLKVTADNGSHVEYAGTPKIEKNLRNGSSLKTVEETPEIE